eukprot:1004057-Pyramimonas_sp.AAC.1
MASVHELKRAARSKRPVEDHGAANPVGSAGRARAPDGPQGKRNGHHLVQGGGGRAQLNQII